jgi:5-oxoprolinase (ATP-hydrolysing)
MPVHLGSMDETVAAVVRAHRDAHGQPAFRPGDAFVHNAPYNGGTHLPDVTVVLPVFDGDSKGALPVAFVAARGHHADIGGVTPGSMPPFSKTIDDEGVLFDSVPLVRGGRFLEEDIRRELAGGPHPARNPDQNIRDLKAQLAACIKGEQELKRAFRAHGLGTVSAYMGHVQDNAEVFVRRAIGTLRDGEFTCRMDDSAEIRVRVTVDPARGEATVDFAGTSAQHPGNLNAPRAVTRAAVLYVFRTLVDADIPMNAGCLRPIRILVPEGSMLAPRPPAAVCAGNVETSQVVVDALFGALGVMAASQGTMNNFTFGDARSQYYETICGGQGAGCPGAARDGFDGASAVHTHMTNSRLTDPEVLESRYSVRVESFAVRAGSGGTPSGANEGKGGFKGGDGVVRKIRFLAPMTAAILSDRRNVAPFGLDGGGEGAKGRNAVQRTNGQVEELAGTAETKVEPGDIFIIETPGGGACG